MSATKFGFVLAIRKKQAAGFVMAFLISSVFVGRLLTGFPPPVITIQLQVLAVKSILKKGLRSTTLRQFGLHIQRLLQGTTLITVLIQSMALKLSGLLYKTTVLMMVVMSHSLALLDLVDPQPRLAAFQPHSLIKSLSLPMQTQITLISQWIRLRLAP